MPCNFATAPCDTREEAYARYVSAAKNVDQLMEIIHERV
jgi:hypothetical protein